MALYKIFIVIRDISYQLFNITWNTKVEKFRHNIDLVIFEFDLLSNIIKGNILLSIYYNILLDNPQLLKIWFLQDRFGYLCKITCSIYL